MPRYETYELEHRNDGYYGGNSGRHRPGDPYFKNDPRDREIYDREGQFGIVKDAMRREARNRKSEPYDDGCGCGCVVM